MTQQIWNLIDSSLHTQHTHTPHTHTDTHTHTHYQTYVCTTHVCDTADYACDEQLNGALVLIRVHIYQRLEEDSLSMSLSIAFTTLSLSLSLSTHILSTFHMLLGSQRKNDVLQFNLTLDSNCLQHPQNDSIESFD